MKWVVTISFLFVCANAFPQTPAELAKQLTSQHNTERSKITAIFNWITTNISYRTRPAIKKTLLINVENPDEEDDKCPLKPLNERVAETVLKNRMAVCDGYSRLFATLCEHAGIRSEVIIGYAKTGINKPTQRFGVNHYWNAVMIDSNWYLLDATWASGYISTGGDRFIREYDDKYFLTSPEIFIRDHYPDDARWTLLEDSKVPEEFRRSPFKQKSFTKYRITSFYPAAGVIETFVGDTIRLQLETAVTEQGRDVSPDLLIDSAIFSHSPSWIFLKPDTKNKFSPPGQHTYIYTVASPNVEWLYLLYNDDLVLRYKINVRKRKA
ncbi:MAG: transglutaminase domain-containing protein [Chitinophagaceae bacterium]